MTFDAQIQTTTQDEIVPKVVDETLTGNVLPLIFLAQARPWAGESLKFPVKVTNSSQNGSFSDFTEFKAQNESNRIMLEFDPRAFYQSVVIGGIARSVNAVSKTKLLDLVKVEMESATQDMADAVGTLLYGTGSNGLDFLGVAAAVDDGNTVATYGGQSRATYTSLASTIQTSVGAWDFAKARTLHNSASRGNKTPTIDVCDKTTYGYVEADYTATVDHTVAASAGSSMYKLTQKGIVPAMSQGITGKMGFTSLYYDGTPIVRDEKCGVQKLWSFNTDFIRFYGVKAAEATPVDLKAMFHEGNSMDEVPSSVGFNWTGFVRPAKQFAWIGQFLLIGNLVCPAPNLSSSSAGISS